MLVNKLKLLVPLMLVLMSAGVWAKAPVLRFRQDGRFRIIQFTDLHWITGGSFESKNDSTSRLMESLITDERPDLIVLTGDNVVSAKALEGWRKLVQPFVRHNIPFVITFGNHDTETDAKKKEVLDFLKQFPNHLTFNADENIDGAGNCFLPVMSHNGELKKWGLYFFDSHAYPKNDTYGAYDWIKPNQIQWYRGQRDALIKESGKVLPSLAFFHIPTPEYKDVKAGANTIGARLEDVCSPSLNTGLIAAFLERHDVLGSFAGHDHNNDFIGVYRDEISLAYGRKTGYAAAYKETLERGARMITIYEDEDRFDTYIRTLNGKTDPFSFEKSMDTRAFPAANGSFIQDYLVAQWDDRRWMQEFETLREAGMQYMVLGPALYREKEGPGITLYPSGIKGVVNAKGRDIIDRCLRNAEKAGFKVFIGLNFDEKWWDREKSASWLHQQMETGNKVAGELYQKYKTRYPNAFYGWYWVWEVANVDELKDPANQKVLADALNINLDFLSRHCPDMPFMLAPFMNYKLGTSQAYAEMWRNVFAQTRFRAGDIFAPQDCVGAGGLDLQHVGEWFKALGQAVKTKPVLRFWSDAETFDQRFWTSATIDRFVKQMDLVSPYVSGIITFAYSHYYTPFNGEDGFHKAYLEYLKEGKLQGRQSPPAVTGGHIEQKEKGLLLQWTPVESTSVCGYYVYRDGVKIADLQKRKEGRMINQYTDKNGEQRMAYKVTSYNAIGDESEPLIIK